jgi:hypothetical protein
VCGEGFDHFSYSRFGGKVNIPFVWNNGQGMIIEMHAKMTNPRILDYEREDEEKTN